jgi:hypothetical protein
LAVLYERTIKRPATKWKKLELKYGRDRTRLWRLAKAAERKMQQQNLKMQHRADGLSADTAQMLAASTTGSENVPMSQSGLRTMPMVCRNIFGGGGTPNAAAPVAVPTPSDPAVLNAQAAQQQAAARARGRAATVLTGGMGVQANPQLMGKVLLGQ